MAVDSNFDDDIIDYRYYVDLIRTVLLKHYKSMAVFSALCVIGSVLYVQSQAPVYVSTVTLHIAPSDAGIFSFDQMMWSDEDKFQDTQVGILQSNKLLRRVVEKADLLDETKLKPASFDAGIASAVKRWLASLNETPVTVIAPDDERIRVRADELASVISIAKPPGREYSNLLNIAVRMADPVLSARVANTMAEEYMALVFENEIESARKNQQFLLDRLAILREELRTAEMRLQAYRESEDIVTRSSGQNELDEELAALSNRYFEARENRLRRENLHQQIQNVRPDGNRWEKLPAIANHPRLSELQSQLSSLNRRKSELSKRYGSRHNKMIALESEIKSASRTLVSQVSDIIEGIRNEYELALQIEKAAEETLNMVRARKQQQGRKKFQINDLQQDVETKREVYSIFLERLNQDDASGPMLNDNLWIADPATVPSVGQRTPLSRAGLLALVLSLGGATALGLMLELTRNKVSSGEDVEKKLSMPLLGYLPLVAGDHEEPGLTFREYITNPESRFSEALRTIRTAISLSSLNNDGIQRLLVTSSQAHEGKTSVALNLAAAFGHTCRVLLIDGDLRKPSIERILNSSNHKSPGLSDLITHNASIDDTIVKLEKEQIDVLFAGSRTLRPLELLASRQFSDLMAQLSERYDMIILDSPPCISVSDAYVIATKTDSIVFVVKCDEVPVPIVRSCLNRFEAMDASIVGVVINQIDFDAAHYYGKYQDYYDYHGYTGEDHDKNNA